jgi:chorismate-pyruvate lyase
LQRERCLRDPEPHAQALLARGVLRMLLHQDGSTTRLLEATLGGPITVHVLEQQLVPALPPFLQGALPGTTFLRRITALEAQGQVLLDSLAYIAVEALPGPMVRDLMEGVRPIGHIVASLWTRRAVRGGDHALLQELWSVVGEPDPEASRSGAILTPDGPCMILAETFRRAAWALSTGATPATPHSPSA